jgi:2-dehydropantoate 2-reductase
VSDILVVGPGAVGAPLAAWLADSGSRVRVLSRGAVADRIASQGIRWATREPATSGVSRVEVVRDLAGGTRPDAVVLAMKSSGLEPAADAVLEAFGKDMLVIGLQNGLDAHTILPTRFKRVCSGIVHFNGWIESDGTFACQKRGPVLVTRGPWTTNEDLDLAHALFAPAVTSVRSPFGRDAALCKMVINLTGSLTALVDFPARAPDDAAAFQSLLATMLAEGVSLLRADGAREVRVPGTPPWRLLEASNALPRFVTRPIFEKNLGKMQKSSLAQDLEKGVRASETELPAIHGALLTLADARKLSVPVMRGVYRLCMERMETQPFVPMRVSEVARAIGR